MLQPPTLYSAPAMRLYAMCCRQRAVKDVTICKMEHCTRGLTSDIAFKVAALKLDLKDYILPYFTLIQ